MGSAAEPEPPPWEPSTACQPRMRMRQPKPRVPLQATTQLSSLNLPLLIDRPESSGRSPLPVIFSTAQQKPPAAVDLTCIAAKFRPVTHSRGKPKTAANAAFLGELLG